MFVGQSLAVASKDTRIGFRADDELVALLDQAVERMPVPKDRRGGGKGYSDVIRLAIETFLAGNKPLDVLTNDEAALVALFRQLRTRRPEQTRTIILLASMALERREVAGVLGSLRDLLHAAFPADAELLEGSPKSSYQAGKRKADQAR